MILSPELEEAGTCSDVYMAIPASLGSYEGCASSSKVVSMFLENAKIAPMIASNGPRYPIIINGPDGSGR